MGFRPLHDRVVVKRIQVDEAPFELPHVKAFGPDGKLLWEKSDGPAPLAQAVEGLLH